MRGATGSANAGAARATPGDMAALLDGSDEGIVLCDADGVVLLANAAAARLAPEIVPGRPVPPQLDQAGSNTVTYGGRVIRVRTEAAGDHRALYLSEAPPLPRRAEFLLEAARRLFASLHPRRCARAAVDLGTEFLCDLAVVVLPPATNRRVEWIRAVAGHPGPEEGVMPLSTALRVPGLTDALAGLTHGSGGRQDAGAAPDWLLPEGFGPAGDLLVFPLPGNGVPAGAMALVRRAGRPPFDDEALAMVRDLASRAGAALSAASLFREQSAVNAILIDDLLPPDLPEVEGMRLAGRLRSSQQAGAVGGDFYDVYMSETGAGHDSGIGILERPPLIILGDVCGKGARAAVLAGQVRQSLRALLLLESRPVQLLELLNRSLLASPAPNSYVTLVLAALRVAPDEHVLVDLAVAGHPPPLVLRRDGTVEEAPARGSLLGALKKTVVRPATVDLAPGEVCLLYSDGITEAFGGPTRREMFGEERLKEALASCAGMPVDALVERLEQISSEWLAGGQQDDRALLAVRAGGYDPATGSATGAMPGAKTVWAETT
ncbi:PP2C family protein-serine/threonine phosphatase [Microbispora sp. H10949]|uniref:PP2C family protein-serine/threonine phosphatase n=1 Tax=Microbispora sp. H10949 TaxID=2729111 RepID=UPI001601F3EB|nr:PP2C family protein-serine/threonine phosphatase [Microbispora sp. H10949]